MKPMWPVSLFIAAAAPTRNEPSCSANVIDTTFGASTTESMMPNCVSGVAGRAGRHRVAPQEPDGDDQAVAVVDEQLEPLGAVRLTGRGRLRGLDAEVGLGLVETGGRRVVEREVATAGDVVHQADLVVGAVGLR